MEISLRALQNAKGELQKHCGSQTPRITSCTSRGSVCRCHPIPVWHSPSPRGGPSMQPSPMLEKESRRIPTALSTTTETCNTHCSGCLQFPQA